MSFAMYAASIDDDKNDIIAQKRKAINKTQRQKVTTAIEELTPIETPASVEMGNFTAPQEQFVDNGPSETFYFPNTNFVPEENTLLKKVNYLISLIESQQDEKTSYVTEEVILYFFLGIFIIFIVDSFVRVGKYIR